jgi:hypothetical protein
MANNREALRIARALREEFRDRGVPFTQAAYRDELARRLLPLSGKAFDGFVDRYAQIVDDDATRDRGQPDPAQPDLPGLEWADLHGEYKLGDMQRVAKRHATIDHADCALALAIRNANDVVKALQKKLDGINRLRPFWPAGTSKSQAFEDYLKANPPHQVG